MSSPVAAGAAEPDGRGCEYQSVSVRSRAQRHGRRSPQPPANSRDAVRDQPAAGGVTVSAPAGPWCQRLDPRTMSTGWPRAGKVNTKSAGQRNPKKELGAR